MNSHGTIRRNGRKRADLRIDVVHQSINGLKNVDIERRDIAVCDFIRNRDSGAPIARRARHADVRALSGEVDKQIHRTRGCVVV